MNISSFDLNLLRVFLAVYKWRNVTRAAQQLGITQSAASNAIARLRKVVKDPLFVATRKGMEPTVLADGLAPAVSAALELVQQAIEAPAAFDPATSHRTFKLLMSDVGETVVLPDLVSAAQFRAPGVRIESIRLPQSQYSEVLAGGGADLAIGNLSFLDEASFFQQRLYRDAYLVIARPHHPCIRHGAISEEDFLQSRYVVVTGGNGDALVDAMLTRRGVKRDVAAFVASYQAAALVVSQSDLLGIFPSRAIPPSVRAVHSPIPLPEADVRQFWHRRMSHDSGVRWLRQVLAEMNVVQGKPSRKVA